MTFPFHSIDSAPEAARPLLEGAQKTLGFVPNLYAGLSTAPQALDAYLTLGDIFAKTSFTPAEQQVILLNVSVENNCTYCVAAHSVIAKQMVKVDESVVNSIREQKTIDDSRLEALAQFTQAVVQDRGFVNTVALNNFIDAGFTQQQVLEVILGVSMKTLSNYSNHVLQTPTDEQFVTEAWSKKE